MGTLIPPPTNYGPGVYFQEISSGSHSITGVSTSMTAFVGNFERGPTGTPVLVGSYSEFQTRFGAVVTDSPVSWAIEDFFLNGGSQAYIVRIYSSGATAPAKKGKAPAAAGGGSDGIAKATIGGADFAANSPGDWGNSIKVAVTTVTVNSKTVYGVTVTYTPSTGGTLTENFNNVSTDPNSPKRIDHYVSANSQYVTVAQLPASLSAATATALTGGTKCGALTSVNYLDPKTGFQAALAKVPVFNLLYVPPPDYTTWQSWAAGDDYSTLLDAAAAFCQSSNAFLICDPLPSWSTHVQAGTANAIDVSDLGIVGDAAEYGAVYFPNPDMGSTRPTPYPVGGIVAGITAHTDATRGVWKAPAGQKAAVMGATGLPVGITPSDRGILNSGAINAFKTIHEVGTVIWGARTLAGADVLDSDYKYINVRRLTSYIELSLVQGTQWAVFEPNDETLWASLQSSITAFMSELWRQGALAGTSQKDAFSVQVGASTTSRDDQRAGRVNIIVSFAPVYPAEFIILYIEQQATSAS